MASKALWALHFERNKGASAENWLRRFYELEDLDIKPDRPYAPSQIDTTAIPGSWFFKDTASNLYSMCEPIVLDEDNIVTVFNFAEGQMDKALAKMNCVSKKVDLNRSTGSSP